MTLPQVTICYPNTGNEIGDVCLAGEVSTFEAQAVVTPNVSGSLTWINKVLPTVTSFPYCGYETVEFTPTGMTHGVTDTVTWHYYDGSQSWNNPFYSEPMTSTNAMGGYSWTGVLPLNCDDDNLSGTSDASETSVAGEDDLVAVGMSLLGCSAWLLAQPATGIVTVAQTGTGEINVWKNATKTAAGGNPGPNVMYNGSTLFLEGKTESDALGDVQIGEQYGAEPQTNAYTVLRLDVQADINHDDTVNKDDMTAARAQPIPGLIIGRGATNRVLVQLQTECALNSGTVTLSLDGGAAGSVRLWESPTSYSGETPFLVSGQSVTWQDDEILYLPEYKALYMDATDGGSATLTYSYADDSQCIGFNSYLPITALEATLNELWETSNRVNQIFNPTPKDDPPPASSNKLYVVESPVNNRYHVTLDVADQPASLRNILMYAVYDGGTIVTYDFFPVSGPVNIVFDHTASKDGALVDFDLKCGWDVNGNGELDSFDVLCPVNVKNFSGQIIGPAIVKGASTTKYGDSVDYINNAFYDPFIPHAKALLHIFLDGNTSAVATDRLPTQTNTVNFDCYSDPFCIWLTHNAGAPFNSSGTASIQQYVWGTNTSLADLTCNSYQMKTAVQLFYNSNVLAVANAFFATNPVGTIATFPLDGTAYGIPHPDESLPWVANYLSGATVAFDEPLQYNGVDDDINGTIGRGRILSHTAQFTIEKVQDLFDTKLVLTNGRFTGIVEDLYDFNAEDQGAGGDAAIIQLGHGNGGYGSGRASGFLFRDRIEFDEVVSYPF